MGTSRPLPRKKNASNSLKVQMCVTAGGLVQVTKFAVLPSPSPLVTLGLVLLALLPCLFSLWQNPKPESFLPATIYACLCSFMFGYHVHEKAILMVTIPMALTAADSQAHARHYFLTATVGHVALMPLLFTEQEYPIKVRTSQARSILQTAQCPCEAAPRGCVLDKCCGLYNVLKCCSVSGRVW